MPIPADEDSQAGRTEVRQPIASSPHTPAGDPFPVPFAADLDRLGLRPMADFLLDVCRPFSWLGAQAVLVAQPILALFGGGGRSQQLVQWLEQLDEDRGRKP